MADPSPAPINTATGNTTPPTHTNSSAAVASHNTPIPVNTAALPTITLQRAEPPKTLRGLNKPKCIKCGNVARSRCPYMSCKSCCSKAQNPCHIHVLKPNATLADRSASNATSELQISEIPSTGPPQKTASIRQLSSNFTQFNNVNPPVRTRKPLTRKDAVLINEWRFAKLKEYKERNIETENEAFDRYMWNSHLLDEVFNASLKDTSVMPNLDDKTCRALGLKVKLSLNPIGSTNLRKRIQQCVDQELKKLKKRNSEYGIHELHDGAELDPTPKSASKDLDGKTLALQDLNDKLNKARNEEDLKSFLQMLSRVTSLKNEAERQRTLAEQIVKNVKEGEHDSGTSLLKHVKSHQIDKDALGAVDVYFSSLEEIDDL